MIPLECRNIGFSYGGSPIFENISFQISRGRFCVVLGRNGTGKTTLIHCLNRILTPLSGRVFIQGRDIASMTRNDIARVISLLPQQQIDIFPYRVIDVVVMGRAPFLKTVSRPTADDYDRADRALGRLNARYLSDRNFNRISGGERQIVLLARCLVQMAPVMLLDEPTNHLDFNHQHHLLAAIRHLCMEERISVVASMHDPNLASAFADDVLMMKSGRMIAKGPTEEVMTEENVSSLYEMDTRRVRVNGTDSFFLPAKRV